MIFFSLFYNFIRAKKWLVLIYLFVTIIDSIIALFSVLTLVPVIQFMTSEKSSFVMGSLNFYFDLISYLGIEFTLVNSLIIFLAMTIISSISSVILFYVSRVNGYAIVFELRSWALYKFYGQGLTFINGYSFGIMQNTFEKEIDKVADAIYSILQIVSLTIFTLLMISFSMSLSSTMTIIILVSFLFTAFLSTLFGKKISALSTLTVSTANILSSKLYGPMLNAKNVLSFARQEWAYKVHNKAFVSHIRAALNSQTMTFILPEFFKTLSILIAVIGLFYSLYKGEPLSLLLATLAVFIRMLPKIANYSEAYALIKHAMPSVIQYVKLFPKTDITEEVIQKRKIDGLTSSIILENISFSYESREDVLVDINIEIKKNTFVTFVGHSGSGKTTCADVIMGLYHPITGNVLIDGHSLGEIDLVSYLDNIGYVQQDSILLDGSVKENLLWANPHATEEEMWKSLKLVSIDKFIKSLPKQLDTLVGDRGVSISGGQKQRIALALALVRDPDILILDEVTSALDQESERIIRQSLKSLSHKLTIISVTHRPSMAEHSDMIYVFEKGSIVESGNYKDLKKNKGPFLNLMSGDL
jgi:ABC-type multidrug transport system fused ATPase/permease subunit